MVEIRLLDPLQVSQVGVPLHGLDTRRAQALLAYLIARGQSVTRAQVCNLLWGDQPEGQAHANRATHG